MLVALVVVRCPPIAVLRRVAMTAGPWSVRAGEGLHGRHVADVVEVVLDVSVPADPGLQVTCHGLPGWR